MSAARGLEGTCWLAAAILAVALVLGNRGAGASAESIRAAASSTPQLSLRQQRCIERVLSRMADRSEEEVAARIKVDCFASRRVTSSSAGLGPLSCGRVLTVLVTPAANRVAGCLGG
jgi:hypothetical protein